ncbi:MAG: EscU/YscU/HrcU family type III secretion system export apparatus switch protein [Planctomycetes bacterium]|nr:EscU/YscU/HrcU family type III secretion system export apparatus switch protein [Planctomycetota bacterium]
MVEQDKEQRTEDPTEKRRQKAREEGRVARSAGLAVAVLTVSAALLALLWGGRIPAGFHECLGGCLGALPAAGDEDAVLLGLGMLSGSLRAMLPFLIVFVPVAAAVSLAQSGLHFIPERLRPRPEKLAPQLSPGRFVNARSLIETATSILKLAFLLAAFHLATWREVPELLATDSLHALAQHAATLVVRVLLYVGLTLIAISLLDFLLKRWQHEKDLRMTREEVKQEAKDALGDPEVKGRIRRRQRELAFRRMMEAVPQASVVITNPTHYAVALKYERDMPAPLVVAKGRDFVAQRIRELAEAAGIPIVQNPPLARALHDTAEPGDEIPPHLYQAVAEVLAAIMKTRSRVGRSA